MLIEEGAREPSDAEDAHDADEARAEDRARSELVRGHAAQKNDHEGGREHHHLDERRDRELRNLFAHRPFGAQARNGTDQDRAENADQEDRDGELGIGFGLEVRGHFTAREPLVVAVGETTLEFGIVFEFLAAPEDGERRTGGGAQEGRHRHGEDLPESDALRAHDPDHGGHGGRHRRGHHADPGADDRSRNGALRTNLGGGGHFGDDRIDGEGHVGRADEHHEEGADEGTDKRNRSRPLAKEFFREANEKIETARTLQHGRTRDHRGDDEENGDGGRSRLHAEHKHHDAHAEAASSAEADAAQTSPDRDAEHHDEEL